MTAREPLADITEEARQVLAGCAARDVSARLIGGLAVAMHRHTPTPSSSPTWSHRAGPGSCGWRPERPKS